jgi:small subunit ribosomal protein S15
MLDSEIKAGLVSEFGGDAKNTGKADVQIAIFTKRIEEITGHLKKNPKDFSARRGLMLLVGKRRAMLDYVHKKDVEVYRGLLKSLGIRK